MAAEQSGRGGGLAVLAWALLAAPAVAAELPYSQLVAEVRSGHVQRVVFHGARLEADLRRPLTVTSEGRAWQLTHFNSTLPSVPDPSFLPLLLAQGVEVNARPEPGRGGLELLLLGLPLLVLLWLLVRNQQAAGAPPTTFGFGQSRAKLYTSERPAVSFKDVAGADEAKRELEEVVQFLKEPQRFRRLGARIPRGVLLVGPPGTGKTLLARAVAGEAGVPFFSIAATEFVEMFVGVGASRVRDLFEKAKARSPAIVFVDEIDSVGRRRGVGLGNVNDEREQTLNQLLSELDGFEPHQDVIVVAATNRPDVLDPALLRPGRFDRRVTVGLPDRAGRAAILRLHVSGVPLAPEVALAALARETPGFSGADLANLVNEAALGAAARGGAQVAPRDFEEAKDKLIMGVRRPTLLDPQERRLVATHEAGHALVAHFLPGADPLRKVTIVPHGAALGVTQMLPDEKYAVPRSYLLDRLAVQLGGRAAEELIFGEVTTGAEHDLVEATRLARRMVRRWGMGEALGDQAFEFDDEQELARPSYAEATGTLLDAEVRRLLTQAHARAHALLAARRPELERLAATLLAEEVLDAMQLAAVVGPRPPSPPAAGGGLP